MRPIAWFPALLLGACGFLADANSIRYPMKLDQQEFKHDFGADFSNQMGNFPTVACAGNTALCANIKGLPAGASSSCDAGSGQCVATYDLRLPVPVDLSKQASLPTAVTNSSVINEVQVEAVNYWAAANSLNFDTPSIEVYIGGQTAMKESDPGVSRLGTMSPIARMTKTACRSGTPGTADSACDLALTESGKNVLATLARDFKTPFNVLLVAHLTVRGGEPFPSGVLDLFLQPVIAFVLPLR